MHVCLHMYIYIYIYSRLFAAGQTKSCQMSSSIRVYSLYLIVCFDNPMCEVMLPAGNCEFKTLQD